MTSEKMLEMIMKVYDQLDAEEKKHTDYYLKNVSKEIFKNSFDNSTLTCASLGCTVGEIIRVLKQDILNSENKTNGKSKQAAVIKSVIKIAKQENNCTKWHSTHIINGKQYALCGYYGLVFDEPVNGVPVSEDRQDDNAILNIFDFSSNINYDTELDIPDRAKLAAYIKTTKAKRKNMSKYAQKEPIIFDFGGDLPMVNAEYLLNVIDGLPDGKLMFSSSHRLSPLHVIGSDGKAILLPIRKRSEGTQRTEL